MASFGLFFRQSIEATNRLLSNYPGAGTIVPRAWADGLSRTVPGYVSAVDVRRHTRFV